MELDYSYSAYLALIFVFCTPIQMLMSVSITMEVANTAVKTQIQVTHVPAIMATDLRAMDVHVKVSKR